jgi:two-component system, OmpR family, sensor histidine kinase SenX3
MTRTCGDGGAHEAEIAAWKESLSSREAILATMREGIVLFALSSEASVRYANPAAAELLGRRLDDLSQIEPAEIRDAVRSVQRGEARVELTLTTAGRVLDVEVHHVGPPAGALLIVRDVTAIRQTEEMRRDFVANASHELKTPVASIVALAAALERALDDPEATRRFVGALDLEAERLAALVADLLDLSRLENTVESPEPVRFDRVVREEVEKAHGEADRAQVALEIRASRPVEIMGRAGDLGRLVHNLVLNAIRYTRAGGAVTVTLRAVRGHAVLAVEDNGIGIPGPDLDRIFERFYRVDTARTRVTGGTGLGLSIVKHVAETHGGSVEVASVPGEGSTFTVTFPLKGANTVDRP